MKSLHAMQNKSTKILSSIDQKLNLILGKSNPFPLGACFDALLSLYPIQHPISGGTCVHEYDPKMTNSDLFQSFFKSKYVYFLCDKENKHAIIAARDEGTDDSFHVHKCVSHETNIKHFLKFSKEDWEDIHIIIFVGATHTYLHTLRAPDQSYGDICIENETTEDYRPSNPKQ